ncbi:hypothetical protein DFP73DRAFT_565803 [Morchella snyderi]|nr:hypothetical protein DFP73DRAFT_565803 [Morchella snyderi]
MSTSTNPTSQPTPQPTPTTPSIASPQQSAQNSRNDSQISIQSPETEPLFQYPRGYPSLSATMNSDLSLAMFRRFGKIRIRSLLYKQDYLAELERRLYVLDLKEKDQVNLSSRRFDNNAERKEIMVEIGITLKDYDKALFNCSKIFGSPAASAKNIEQLSQWIDDSQPLEAEEQRFLEDRSDVIALREDLLERGTQLKLAGFLAKKYLTSDSDPRNRLNSDPNVYYIPDDGVLKIAGFLKIVVRVVVTITAAATLLVPIVILCFVKVFRWQMFTIVISTLTFSAAVASTRASNGEIFGATAAYAAVMTVFLGSVVNSSI